MALFKRNPTAKLKKVYEQKMESAMHAMRRGDVRENARLVAEAEEIRSELKRYDLTEDVSEIKER